MLKAIVSGPAFAFASVIAWRSEPAPVSAVLMTVKVFAGSAAESRQAARTTSRPIRAAVPEADDSIFISSVVRGSIVPPDRGDTPLIGQHASLAAKPAHRSPTDQAGAAALWSNPAKRTADR